MGHIHFRQSKSIDFLILAYQKYSISALDNLCYDTRSQRIQTCELLSNSSSASLKSSHSKANPKLRFFTSFYPDTCLSYIGQTKSVDVANTFSQNPTNQYARQFTYIHKDEI